MQLLWVLSLLATVCSCSFIPSQTWENTNLERSINLAKSYIKEEYRFEIKNIDSQPNDEYFFALPNYIFDNLSVFSVIAGHNPSGNPQVLQTELVDKLTEVNGEALINYIKVTLPIPIAPKQTYSFSIALSITNLLEPLPSKIDITDEQTLLLKTFKEPLSAYKTIQSELNLNGVAQGKELNISGKPIGVEGEIIGDHVHYQFGKVDAFKFTSLAFLYKHNAPLNKVSNLKRDVWISHWGNTLQFEEFYKLTNKAASLTNGFARVDFMLNQKALTRSTHALTAVQIQLLPDAQDIYYTDLVGNVSTSRAFGDKVYIKPRYPVFGGWNYNFTIGWTNKLSTYMSQYSSDEYIVKVPIITGPVDTTYDEVELSFFLPEGSEILDIYSPIPYESIEEGNELSYFDLNKGHTKVTLKFLNLVDELSHLDVIVKYKFTFWDFIKKPLDISKFIFIALISYLLISKIDVSLKAKK